MDIKKFPFKVENDGKNKPQIVVDYKGKKEKFYPEEISALVLSELKKTAENYLGKDVTSVVITVPANFTNEQRTSTRLAAKIAGFKNVTCINEPTAAAIAYGRKNITNKRILVFDLGGGTFDVSVLELEDSFYDVITTAGDLHLGGEDFDNCLLDYLMKKIQDKHGKDLSSDEKAIFKLKSACVVAKHNLTAATQAVIKIDHLFDDIDYKETITRARFNEICKSLFEKTISIVNKALNNKNLSKNDLDSIIVIGGSTRIPAIIDKLSEYFNVKKLDKSMHPDEAVAIGAAMHAANIFGNESRGLQKYLLNDIVPYNLGIKAHHNDSSKTMSVLINKGSKISISISQNYKTSQDNQTSINIEIYEGQHETAKRNNLLGSFIISNLTLLPKEKTDIEVTFEVDESGILNVSAIENVSQKSNRISVSLGTKRFSDNDIGDMVQKSKKLRKESDENKNIDIARNGLEEFCFKIKDKIKANNLDYSGITDACEDILNWLNADDNLTEDEILNKQKELKSITTEMFNE